MIRLINNSSVIVLLSCSMMVTFHQHIRGAELVTTETINHETFDFESRECTAWETSLNSNIMIDYDEAVSRMSAQFDCTSKTFNEFTIFQTYPNPFNQEIRIPIALATYGVIRISLYDVLGYQLFKQYQLLGPGYHIITLNVTSKECYLSSGLYILAVRGFGKTFITKIVYIK